MSKKELDRTISRINPPDDQAMKLAQARLDSLAKPPGSLGKLESVAVTLAGIGGDVVYDPGKRCVIIMASDNGVVEEGVAAAPQSVTYAQTLNFTKGITGVGVIAKQFQTDLLIVDVGVKGELNHPLIKNKKIRQSTWNIAKGPAMTDEEAVQAVLTGIEIAIEAVAEGYTLLGAGEMGIGNTTTSSAVLCALTGISATQAAGKGAGLKEDDYRHKIHIIETALRHNQPDPADPLDVLAKVGGFDIAAMAGVFLGGALMKVPVVIDGLISMVAALAAFRMNPLVKAYMLASHESYEQGFRYASEALGVEPCLQMQMRLGEGSGCPLMFAIIDAACAVMREMGTFAQASIEEEYLEEIKEGDSFTIRRE